MLGLHNQIPVLTGSMATGQKTRALSLTLETFKVMVPNSFPCIIQWIVRIPGLLADRG